MTNWREKIRAIDTPLLFNGKPDDGDVVLTLDIISISADVVCWDCGEIFTFRSTTATCPACNTPYAIRFVLTDSPNIKE